MTNNLFYFFLIFSLHLQPFSAAGFFRIREIQRPKWSPWELNAAPRARGLARTGRLKSIPLVYQNIYMFYGQWGEQCSLQRKRQYFLDEDGKDKKVPKSGVTSLPLRRMRRALIQGFRLRAESLLALPQLLDN
jgi:hypothetical protein